MCPNKRVKREKENASLHLNSNDDFWITTRTGKRVGHSRTLLASVKPFLSEMI